VIDRQLSLAAAAIAAALLIAAACTAHITTGSEPASRPPPPPTPAAPAPGQAVAVAPQAHAQHFAEAAEPGFSHCCGNDEFQLDIECGERLARCYERDGDESWRQTYGRHCKEQLGTSCYLHGCADKCAP
jgi:hypothetical protein